MILDVIIDYLNNSNLDAPAYKIPAYAEVPKENIPEEYYVLELIGDPMVDHIPAATIAARSYARSMKRAADLAYDLDNILMNGLINLDYISGVKRNTIANYTDQSTKEYRYQGVYIITHY